ncbi:MAG: 1-deoxy-D-xylulose-5-phosphate synthase [Candidatus Omnitrophota bacterium]
MKNDEYNLLGNVKSIKDLKKIKKSELPVLAQEIRQFIIENVAKTGGHLGASLGAVELTVALHYFFNSPKDKIIWDVGHQAYAHKILTGRKDLFSTLRQKAGISGFPRINESEHDAFGTGHASTSLSAALGFACARDLKKENHEVIAIIGDGAMTGGNALEAINQVGYLNTKLIVILNDNRMSISENVGGLSKYTHRIEHTDVYQQIKDTMHELIEKGNGLREKLLELKAHLKEVGSPGLLFEKLGFDYIGPIDGHDIRSILEALNTAKNTKAPSLIHCRTIKGKGYTHAENDKSRFHGISAFDIDSGCNIDCPGQLTYTQVFSNSLVELAQKDEKIVAITAAMPDGTGLTAFAQKFPKRFFDVGIAEQHAVVFAAGLACAGFKPVVAIYSTFLQRAYDAIIHDVCLQKLPVIFAIDRAGIVGEDGATHQGVFDISYLRHIPGITILAPSNKQELVQMLGFALKLKKPVALRYPRGCCVEINNRKLTALELGKCEIISKGNNLTIVSIGTMLEPAFLAAQELKKQGISVTLINARFVKPLDPVIAEIINETGKAIIIEENTKKGGFGSAILELCQENRLQADIRILGVKDDFVEHASQEIAHQEQALTADEIIKIGKKLYG